MTVSTPTETGGAPVGEMKKKELVDLVVSRSGIKKKDAKPVVEAMLAVLGESIAEGRELNLQPFGKLRINRKVEKDNGRVTVCKLRQTSNATSDTTALAEAAQDG
ncbi:HU family DNA-binding protein [Microbulbifer sp. S227A]|uniref:HU family DNA-binding protein n=1 Tax=Microbulbifer sp. S227A TaxID=3415131 RepID=UPI003C7D12AA